jgi:Zn-dependent protease
MWQNEDYPEKPELVKTNTPNNWGLTFLSIVAFVGFFLLFFSNRLDYVIALVLALLVHEFGHFLMMKRYHYENVRLMFIPLLGAVVSGSKDRYSQKESIWVVLFGPLPGILMGTLGLFMGPYLHNDFLMAFSIILLTLNAINLLPLDPLDGGQLVKILVMKQHDWYLMIFALVSSLLLIGLGIYIDDWLISGFGFLLGFRVRSMQKTYELRKELTEQEVDLKVSYNDLSNRDFFTISRYLLLKKPGLQRLVENEPALSDQMMANLVKDVLITPVTMDMSLLARILIIGLWVGLLALPFIALILSNNAWYFG